jgi:hypothetical protein
MKNTFQEWINHLGIGVLILDDFDQTPLKDQ